MTRRAKILLLAAGLALSGLGLGLTYRAPLLESVLRAALAARDIPVAGLRVERVGWRETAIADLALGAASEVRARRVTVAYDPAKWNDLLAGRLQSIALDGVILALDLSGDGPPLGSLQGLAAPEGTGETSGGTPGAGTVSALPPVELRDSRIEALTPLGPAVARLEGSLRPGPDGALSVAASFTLQADTGRLSGRLEASRSARGRAAGTVVLSDGALALPGAELSGLRGTGAFSLTDATPESATLDLTLGEIALPGAAFEQARLTLRLADTRLDLEADLATADRHLRLRARAGLEDFPSRPNGELRLEAEAGAQAVLWPLLALPAPSAGRIDATLTARGHLPPLADLLGGSPEALARLRPRDFAGDATLRLQGLDYPGLVQGLSGELRLEPTPAAPNDLAAAVALSMTAESLNSGDLRARRMALNQSAQLHLSDKKIGVAISENGEISFGDLGFAPTLASEGPLSARIAAAAATLDFGAPDGFALTHDVTLVPEPLRLAVARAGAPPLAVRVWTKGLRAAGNFRAAEGYAGRVELEDGRIALPSYEAAAEGLNATLELARDGGAVLAFELGALRHTAEAPALAPIGLRGEVRHAAGTLDFSVTGSGANGVGEASATGRHQTEDGTGEALIALAPLVFGPGGAQPGALFPALAGLRNVAGRARAEAALSWTREALAGTAALTLEDISLDSAAARVEGLSLDLALNQLQPPGSAPGQTLRVRRIDPGVPLEAFSFRFRVVPGDSPAIAIEDAGLTLAGGRFRLVDVVIDPARAGQDLPLRVEGLDLAQVFALLGLEGVSGDGRLSGTIPLRLVEGVPGIAQGRLAAAGPGRLRVKSDYARQALAGAGESADLLLRALEDFHYEELSLTIDQPEENLALLAVSMLGNNPNVLDGRAFRFNINLETDPGKLLTALQAAYLISDRAIRQLWMFGR